MDMQPVAESYRNTRQPWTEEQVAQLRQLARENTPTRVIGLKLGRTPRAVQSKASEQGISLMPSNRSPYGRADGGGRAGRTSGAGGRSSQGRGRSGTQQRRSGGSRRS
jgi:hypothetical protein